MRNINLQKGNCSSRWTFSFLLHNHITQSTSNHAIEKKDHAFVYAGCEHFTKSIRDGVNTLPNPLGTADPQVTLT